MIAASRSKRSDFNVSDFNVGNLILAKVVIF
jgi:hypothetical protein